MNKEVSFSHIQASVAKIYGTTNDRWFDHDQMATNITRFAVRSLKAVRRYDPEDPSNRPQIETNLAISLSWFVSTMNRLHLNISRCVTSRFSGFCPKCGLAPCGCPRARSEKQPVATIHHQEPSIDELQTMFEEIYPASGRDLPDAMMHYVEEVGEFAEATLVYRLTHSDSDIDQVELEAADLISCAFGVWNSLQAPASVAILGVVGTACHNCGAGPCECSFHDVMNFSLGDQF